MFNVIVDIHCGELSNADNGPTVDILYIGISRRRGFADDEFMMMHGLSSSASSPGVW